MKRSEFLAKIIRMLLFVSLAVIGLLLGAKATTAKECRLCPGNGKCGGEQDCTKYKQENERG
jgi:hypothetical protein